MEISNPFRLGLIGTGRYGHNALVIGFPEWGGRGGGTPGHMWGNGDFVGTLQQIPATVVGKMWGLRYKMAQLSGKIWGRSHHLARELGLPVVQ